MTRGHQSSPGHPGSSRRGDHYQTASGHVVDANGIPQLRTAANSTVSHTFERMFETSEARNDVVRDANQVFRPTAAVGVSGRTGVSGRATINGNTVNSFQSTIGHSRINGPIGIMRTVTDTVARANEAAEREGRIYGSTHNPFRYLAEEFDDRAEILEAAEEAAESLTEELRRMKLETIAALEGQGDLEDQDDLSTSVAIPPAEELPPRRGNHHRLRREDFWAYMDARLAAFEGAFRDDGDDGWEQPIHIDPANEWDEDPVPVYEESPPLYESLYPAPPLPPPFSPYVPPLPR